MAWSTARAIRLAQRGRDVSLHGKSRCALVTYLPSTILKTLVLCFDRPNEYLERPLAGRHSVLDFRVRSVAGMLLDGRAERERGQHTILFCPLSSELDSFAAGFPQLAVPGSSPSVSDHFTGSQPSGNISNASVSR